MFEFFNVFDKCLFFNFEGFIERLDAVLFMGKPFDFVLQMFFHIAFVHVELFAQFFQFLGEIFLPIRLGRPGFIVIINFLQKLYLFYQVLLFFC